MDKYLLIMRGIPGSGKSTLAREIVKRSDKTCAILSTDDYWHEEDGTYNFRPKYIGEAHKWNQHRAHFVMLNGVAELVIIDNTSCAAWEYEKYLTYAKEFGYIPYQYVCTGNYENIHGVPEKAIEKMKKKFEDNNDLPHWDLEF